ncbi:MAG: GYF domain-containing protein [Bacteroidales bacterium]|nr:GYF domain-containing protein [Bacteroidales bacterium]
MTADQWYYSHDGERTGPVTLPALRALAEAGGLARDDLVWADGMANWVRAGGVDGLFPPGPNPPPLPADAVGPNAPSPSELKPPVIGMLVVSGLGLLLGLLGTLQATDPGDGMTLLGMALAVSAGVWAFLVIRGPKVRRAFESGTSPPLFGWDDVAKLFDTTDAEHRLRLSGKWEPTQEGEPTLEFTDTGAVIRGDGRAGKYTLDGHRLVIEIEGDPGDRLEIVKLSGGELVLGINGRVRSYRKRMRPGLFGSLLGSLAKAGTSADSEAASQTSEAVSSSDPVVADIMVMMNAAGPKGLDEFETTLDGMGLTPDQLAPLRTLLRQARSRTDPPMKLYCDCPNCGTPLDISDYVLGNKHTGQDVVCRCRTTFSPSNGLNLRNTPDFVERRSGLGRLLWGRTKQKSRKEQADHQISQLHWLIREATLQSNYTKAQFHQSQLNTLLQHYEW